MIKYLKENQVAIITLNRPEKRNALNPELVAQLKDKLKEIKDDIEIKILIITEKAFVQAPISNILTN